MIDAYKIGITLTVNNQIFGELGRIISEFQKVNAGVQGTRSALGGVASEVGTLKRAVDSLASAFGRVKSIAGSMSSAVGAVGGAYAIRQGAEAVMQPAFDQRHAAMGLGFAGMSPRDLAQMQATAREMALSRGDQSTTGYMHMLGVMYGTLQDAHEARALAGPMADFSTSMSGTLGAPMSDYMMQDALKVIEARKKLLNADGSINSAGIQRELSLMVGVAAKTHGRITPSSFRAVVSQEGTTAAAGQSDEAFYGWGAEIQNAMGSSRAGTAMASLMAQLRAGVAPKRVKEAMLANGWIGADGKLDQRDMLDTNPYEWLSGHIASARTYRQAHDPGHRQFSDADIIYEGFGRQTSQREAAEIVALLPQLRRFNSGLASLVNEHPMDQQAAERRQRDPAVVMQSFASAWTDLMASLGNPMVDQALGYVHGLTDAMKSYTEWAGAHPDDVKHIMEQFASMGTIVVGVASLAGAVGLLGKASLLFVVGEAAQIALEKLTGEKGLGALAAGLEGLGKAFDALPAWVISAAVGAMAGARVGGTEGAVIGGAAGAMAPAAAGLLTSSDANFGLGAGAVAARTAQTQDAMSKLRALKKGDTMGADDINKALNAIGTNPAGLGGYADPSVLPGGMSSLPGVSKKDWDTMMGGGAKKMSFVPPGGGANQVHVENVMYLDGDVVHRSVNQRMVRAGSRPSASYSGFDGGRTPRMSNAVMST